MRLLLPSLLREKKAWRLPWSAADVPHALLDVLRGCNLTCRACYNYAVPRIKSLAEIELEVQGLLRYRRLQSIAVVGGEPLLHPELYTIIRMLRRYGLHVELFTNGLLLDMDACIRLKDSGASLVFVHIDSGQNRPDLPLDHGFDERLSLAQEKASLLASAGLEAGLAITAYPGQTEELEEAVRFTLASENLGYLLVTRLREHKGIRRILGTLDEGLTAEMDSAVPSKSSLIHSHEDLQDLLLGRFGLHPFAFLGSNTDPDDARWLSYLVAVAKNPAGRPFSSSIRASAVERLFSSVSRICSGRYPFFVPWSPIRFRSQLLFNALLGGSFSGNVRLLSKTLRWGTKLKAKRILFQNPAEVDATGKVTHCAHCPDAVIVEGKLVPVCIADLHLSSQSCTSP